MPDELDKSLTEIWPTLETLVKEGLAEHKVGDFIAVEEIASTQPWRIKEDIQWNPVLPSATSGGCVVSKAEVRPEGAYKVAQAIELDLEQIRNLKSTEGIETRSIVKTAAGNVSQTFLSVVLSLAQDQAKALDYTYADVVATARSGPWPWRLIKALADEEIFNKAKANGIAVIFDSTIQLRDSAQALMVSSPGPLVTQLDIPVVSWSRKTENAVEKAVVTVERNFLFSSRPENVRVLGRAPAVGGPAAALPAPSSH